MIDPKTATAIAMGLKSAYQIAKELNVTPNAVYNKLRQHHELDIYKKENKYAFDEKGVETVKALFKSNEIKQAVGASVGEPFGEPFNEPLVNQLNKEIAYLREQLSIARNPVGELVGEPVGEPVHALNNQINQPLVNQLTNEIDYLRCLLDTERQKNIELVQQLTELARNSQQLHGLHIHSTRPNLFKRLFQLGRKKES